MKTAISIPDDLFRRAERAARRLGLSRSAYYQRAIATYMERHNDAAITKALDGVYAQEEDEGRLDPIVEQLQYDSLPRDEW